MLQSHQNTFRNVASLWPFPCFDTQKCFIIIRISFMDILFRVASEFSPEFYEFSEWVFTLFGEKFVENFSMFFSENLAKHWGEVGCFGRESLLKFIAQGCFKFNDGSLWKLDYFGQN
jgi:hypothetical protein